MASRFIVRSHIFYNDTVNVSDKIALLTNKSFEYDSLDKKCQQLIAFGNANGGSDNMAVVIWENR